MLNIEYIIYDKVLILDEKGQIYSFNELDTEILNEFVKFVML